MLFLLNGILEMYYWNLFEFPKRIKHDFVNLF